MAQTYDPPRVKAKVAADLRVRVGRRVDATTARLVQAYTAAWQQTYTELLQAVTQAEVEAYRLGRPGPAAYRTNRLQASLDELTTLVRGLNQQAGVVVSGAVAPVVTIPVQVTASLGALAGANFNQASPETLARIVQRTTSKIASDYRVLTGDAEDALRESLVRGVTQGKGPRDVARDVVQQARVKAAARYGLATTDVDELRRAGVAEDIIGEVRQAFNGGQARALNIARTELVDASRNASLTTYAATGLVTGWRWVSALDARTCPACWGMHNTVHPLAEEMEGHQQCIPSGVPVTGPAARAATSRAYHGRLITVVNEHGDRLPVTPNHPVLTRRGWVPASDLQRGDYVFRSGRPQGVAAAVHPDDHDTEARIEDRAESLAVALGMTPVRMPQTAEDFHGDGITGEHVHHVSAGNQGLLLDRDAAGSDHVGKHSLHLRGVVARSGLRDLRAMLGGHGLPAHRVVGGGSPGGASLRGGLGGLHDIGLGLVAQRDSGPQKGSGDRGPTEGVDAGELQNALAGHVQMSEVVELIVTDGWSGHVHNLETVGGWYMAAGIVVHNCRCTPVPMLAGEDLADSDMGDPDEILRRTLRTGTRKQRDQLRMGFGQTRLKYLEDGGSVTAMATRRENAGWRPGHYVTPVRDLLPA